MLQPTGKAHLLHVELASLPVPTEARFLHHNGDFFIIFHLNSSKMPFSVVRVTSSTRDHFRNVKRSTSKTIFISSDSVSLSLPEEVGDVVASASSRSGTLLAILRECSAAGDKKRYVEIW